MPHSVQLSAADIAKTGHLRDRNVKISDIAELMNRSRYGISTVILKIPNRIAEKVSRSIMKNIFKTR